MIPDQLAAARANHWRQNAQPLLTLEDATAWIETMQLVLYLPRRTHVLAPAPSFVEAVAGEGNATPSPEAISQANDLLVRLVQGGTVVPLNLFGTPGEQPDFLVATGGLPYLAALQADRTWKKPPSRTGPGKVSPMAVEVWKLLDREGALTANEIREQLGHELTEAATIRGLSELWQNMRVAPLPSENGEAANWQILSVTHKKEMAVAGTMSQSAALSLLVSNYLQSVVTGTGEDIEAFLSPIASRSRLRDVVRGLTATRQLRSLSMDAQTFLFIDGTLPEMPDVPKGEGIESEVKPAFMGRSAYRERMLSRGKEEEVPVTPGQVGERAGSRSDRPQRFAAGGSSFRKRPASGADRPGFRKPDSGRSGSARTGSDRGSFRRSTGDRPDRPFRPAAGREESPGGDRPRFAGRPSAGDRPRADRPFFKSGDRGAFRPGPGSGATDRPKFGTRPPFRKDGPDRPPRPFRPREDGDRPQTGRRPFRPREDGAPSSDRRNESRAGFQSRTAGRPGRPVGDRPRPGRAFGDRPSSGRSRPPREQGDRPYTPRPRSDSPRRGGTAGEGRPPRRFEGKPPYPRRDAAGARGGAGAREDRGPRRDSRPPQREGSTTGFPSNSNRPSRAPRPAGSYSKTERGDDARSSRPGGGSRPPARGGKPGFSARPGSGDRSSPKPGFKPGRNPGGTGRPGIGSPSGKRPFGPKGGAPRSSGPRSPGRSGTSRPGGMKPPTRKQRPEKDSE